MEAPVDRTMLGGITTPQAHHQGWLKPLYLDSVGGMVDAQWFNIRVVRSSGAGQRGTV